MKKFLPTTGFTLVELLVVVTIIAILSVIGVAIFTNTQKSTRDARRKADIDAIASAYEVTHTSSTGKYRPLVAGDFSSGALPQDPINSTPDGYIYTHATKTSDTEFTACAKLEAGGGNSSNETFVNTGTSHYCRKNQQ